MFSVFDSSVESNFQYSLTETFKTIRLQFFNWFILDSGFHIDQYWESTAWETWSTVTYWKLENERRVKCWHDNVGILHTSQYRQRSVTNIFHDISFVILYVFH